MVAAGGARVEALRPVHPVMFYNRSYFINFQEYENKMIIQFKLSANYVTKQNHFMELKLGGVR